MVNNNKKWAFTLAEALISMLILSIFIGLSMKIFTKKHTKPVYNPSHGFYICYRGFGSETERNKVYEKHGAAAPVAQGNNYCEFTPVKSANYYVVYAVGGGGGGGDSYGGAPGDFTTLFVTSIADPLKIYPGMGGAIKGDGQPTKIENNDEEGDSLILSVNGGLHGGVTTIEQKYVRDCKVVPLASVLANNNYKNYVLNKNMDKVVCTPKKDHFFAELCPHSIHDVRQDDEIFNNDSSTNRSFYKTYVVKASNWYNYSGSTFVNKTFPYTYEDNCITDVEGGRLRYCLDSVNGDRLETRDSASSSNWYSVNATSDNKPKCMSRKLGYNQITIDRNADSSSVVRTDGVFKYIIDLHYDMSKINNSIYISPSGFGDYLENSALKDATTAVLYDPANKSNTSNVVANRFDPSMGDGGYKNTPGYSGAVFIAW